jgi:protein-tyrosine phosphatase
MNPTPYDDSHEILPNLFMGCSRSGLITLLILQKHGPETNQAVDLIRAERKKGSPLHNPHFVEFARKEFGNY